MTILLAAATTIEIQPTADFLERSGFRLGSHKISVLATGVGSVAATHSLMRQTVAHRPGLVIQAGIAGCFTHKKHGDTIVIKEEMLADLGVWEEPNFKTLFDLGLAGRDVPPFAAGLLVNPYKKLLALSALDQERGITVNEITTDAARIGWLQQNLRPVVESMEGGALHYVCLQENIPFLQIRSVSNDIGVRDKTKWGIGAAIAGLNRELTGLLNKLASEDEGILEK
jgi:futalosine hydrolase